MELGVFISADIIMKSSSSRTWHYEPYFLCQPIPFSKRTLMCSGVTMLEVIYIPELRVHKFDDNCQLLSWLIGTNIWMVLIKFKEYLVLCSLKMYTMGMLSPFLWFCRWCTEIRHISLTVQVTSYQLMMTGKDVAIICINMVKLI